ncbi:hypothetical protein B0H15DRAFT_759419, partial [Mycena belliarum]
PGTELLSPDLLVEIMLAASESINERFALAQVSQLWRNTALNSPMLWTSFKGTGTRLDYHRVPLMLGRTGSTALLHIDFDFAPVTSRDRRLGARMLGAFVPYVARIEDLYLYTSDMDSAELAPLLDSYLEFPALKVLYLSGSWHSIPLSLSAPQLRSLEIEYFDIRSWNTLLVPSLEKIKLWKAGWAGTQTLSDIFMRCP